MSKIAILTETSTDLTDKQKANPHIFQIPLYVMVEGKAYKENIDISHEDYYARIETLDSLPKTSQATPEDFNQAIQSILDQGYDHVIIITISEKLSGTYQSAALAAKDFADRVTVYGTQTGSVGEGLIVEAAAKMAEKGYSLEDIVQEVRYLDAHNQLSAVVVSIENLVKGGRVPKIAGGIQSFLGLKLVVNVRDGKLNFLKHSRSMKRALDAMEKDFDEWKDQLGQDVKAIIFHVNDPDQGQAYLQDFQSRFPEVEVELASLGPVIGTHGSTGAIGLAAIPLKDY